MVTAWPEPWARLHIRGVNVGLWHLCRGMICETVKGWRGAWTIKGAEELCTKDERVCVWRVENEIP